MIKNLKSWFKEKRRYLICLMSDCSGMCGTEEACTYCKAYDPKRTGQSCEYD